LTVTEVLANLMIVAILLAALVILGTRWLRAYIHAYAFQSLVLSMMTALMALQTGHKALYLVAVLTYVVRGLIVPLVLLRITQNPVVDQEMNLFIKVPSSLIIGILLSVFAYVVTLRLLHGQEPVMVTAAVAVGLAVVFIGFFVLSSRLMAVTHILALLMIENGIFLASVVLAPGMPLIVELVVLFDILVTVFAMMILVRVMAARLGSTSAAGLTRLTG
jgi:hydrogenase-4 component E